MNTLLNKIKTWTLFKTKKIGDFDQALLKRYLPNNPVILEAGAFDGTDTLAMINIWPNATIYAFEPDKDSYKLCYERVQTKKNVQTFNLALGDKNGEANFFKSGGSSAGESSSLLMPKDHLKFHPSIRFDHTDIVNVVTLDDWANNNKVEKIDFLWLDMQGFELKALQHGENILKTVNVILTEVSLVETYYEVPLYAEYKEWLQSRGFKVIKEALFYKDMGNVLFGRDV